MSRINPYHSGRDDAEAGRYNNEWKDRFGEDEYDRGFNDRLKEIKRASRFYEVTYVIEMNPDEVETWDASCDETFNMDGDTLQRHMVDYQNITEKEFHNRKHDIFTPEGGI